MERKKKPDAYDFVINPRTKAVTGTLSCGVRIEIIPTANPKDWHKIMQQIISNPNSFVDDINNFGAATILPKNTDRIHAVSLLKIASGFTYGILETGESGFKIDNIEDNKKVTLHIVQRAFKEIIKKHSFKIGNLKNFTKTYINDGLNRLNTGKPLELTLLISHFREREFWHIMFLLASAKIFNEDIFCAPEYSDYTRLINKAFPNL